MDSKLKAQIFKMTTGYDCTQECPSCAAPMYPFDCRLDDDNNAVCKGCSNYTPIKYERRQAWKVFDSPSFPCINYKYCENTIDIFNHDVCHDLAKSIGGKLNARNCFAACRSCNQEQGQMLWSEYQERLENSRKLFHIQVRNRLIGSVVKKLFENQGEIKYYYGDVVSEKDGVYTVAYDDETTEEMEQIDVEEIIVNEDPAIREGAWIHLNFNKCM